jgi:hypothetical protein
MYKECRHILPQGSRCHAVALKDSPYCYHHDRIHRALLRQRSAPKDKLELPILEDRRSVQIALSQVIGALAAGRIDGANAGRLIYGLQVAAQHAPVFVGSPIGEQVGSVIRTDDGDELAPENIKCFKGDNCATCPFLDECGGDREYRDAHKDEQDDDDDEDDDEDNAGEAAGSDDKAKAVDEEDEEDGEDDDDDEDENDDDPNNATTEELVAEAKYLESVSNALKVGDMRQAARLLGEPVP